MDLDEMPKVDFEKGIPSLMSDIWLRHKLGLPQETNQVYQVNLPEASDMPRCMNGNRKTEELQKPYNTFFDLIQHVEFENVIPYLNKEVTAKNLIVYKDAFDYLYDLFPDGGDIDEIKIEEGKDGDIYFDLMKIKPFTKWSTFIGFQIDYSSLKEEIKPEKLVASLLISINNNDDNIYRFRMMEPLRGKWTLSEKFVYGNRKRKSLLYRLFTSSKKRKKDEMELDRISRLVNFCLRCCLDERLLVLIPNEILEMVQKADITNVLGILHLRSHIHQRNAVEYLEHTLTNYDTEAYENKDVLVILEYSFSDHYMIVEFLKNHYHTNKIVAIKSTTGDMRLSRMILKD